MALLDRPIFGTSATGTLARALSFRKTVNPPDLPGETVVSMGTVAKIPFMSCPPSPAQILQRARYAAAVAAWRALSGDARGYYNANKPANLSGFNFFLRFYFFPSLVFFGYCVYGSAIFSLSTAPDQPAAADYYSLFPAGLDEFPTLLDGAHSPQAWLVNRAYSAMLAIEDYLIVHKATIEAG